MFDISNGKVQRVIGHIVGNKENGDDLILSDKELDASGELIQQSLRTYFLSNFHAPAYYSFQSADGDVMSNPMYTWVNEILGDFSRLTVRSKQIARHLYVVSKHPNIKAGELYVACLTDVVIDNKLVDAIGLFKAETRDTYLKLKNKGGTFDLLVDQGTNIKKLDKGCLIFNTEQEAGYKILVVDQVNGSEAQFWKNDFLNVAPWSDSFHHTQNFLGLTREYLGDKMLEDFNVNRADQIDLMNRSIDFFKSRDHFDQHEFETEVLADPNVIESFRKFGNEYRGQSEVDIIDNFEISAQAVKRQARIFKSVLKLDRNFHIYIHGNRELIERGFDEVMGKKYYKIYFDSES